MNNHIFHRPREILSKSTAKLHYRIFSNLALGGILFLGIGVTLPNIAYTQTVTNNVTLPESVADLVLLDISKRSGFPTSELRTVGAEKKTWSDRCLGLAAPGQVCAQFLISGWRVTVESDRQLWFYRTDDSGLTVKLEGTLLKQAVTPPPISIINAVFLDASQRSGLPVSELIIVQAEKEIWENECLGLPAPGQICTDGLVPGWRVTVEGGKQRWVYRTDQDGFVVLFDTAASKL